MLVLKMQSINLFIKTGYIWMYKCRVPLDKPQPKIGILLLSMNVNFRLMLSNNKPLKKFTPYPFKKSLKFYYAS